MINFLDVSVNEALISSFIVGKKNSYLAYNPREGSNVIAYLRGGLRPERLVTSMGKHLVALEDARRAGYAPPSNTSSLEYSDGLYNKDIYSK